MSVLDITKYTIRDLTNEALLSEILSLEEWVTTPYRVASYIRNPRALEEDIVLYILRRNGKVIAYRSLLSDEVFLDNKKIHISWFSGNYVVPDERRKGYSSKLLEEVEKDWGDRLFFSNFAWPSKYVLDQEGEYVPFQTLKGRRYYFRFGLAELLPPKSSWFERIKGALFQADRFLNALYAPLSNTLEETPEWEKVYFPDDQDFTFMEKSQHDELFKRGKEEFEWILKHPWVSTKAEAEEWSKTYHFSVYAHDFDLSFYRLRMKGATVGLLLISIKEGAMHIPYCYVNKGFFSSAARLLLSLAAQHKMLHLTVFHDVLTAELNKFSGYFLFSKKFEQAFLCNSSLLEQYPGLRRKHIQKGDGDAVFT